MPFNGSGTFSRIYSWVTDAGNGIDVRSDRMDTDTNDIANALSNCVTRDGQSPPTADLPMGGHKLTGMGNGSSATDSVAYGQLATVITAAGPASLCDFRLTGTSGSAVPTADQTTIGTLYCTPYKGNAISLYDGSGTWNKRVSAEFSIAVPAVASTVHDVFCYDNGGTPTLEVLAWTNDTTRATALVLQDGVYVKSGSTTRRYLGTFRTNGSNKIVDSLDTRWLFNYYNRVRRPMRRMESTSPSWTYTTATWRQANGAVANQLDFVVGVDEEGMSAQVIAVAANSTTGTNFAVGIGLDATTFPSASGGIGGATSAFANASMNVSAAHRFFPGVGRHYAAWLEYSVAAGTTTWYGDNEPGGNPMAHSGIFGEVFA